MGELKDMLERYWTVPLITIIIVIIIGFVLPDIMTEGEKRWETYSGTIKEFNVNCDLCCHPSSYFVIETSRGTITEHIMTCDESLNSLIKEGNYYTIRLEPFAEPYASRTGSFWDVTIDWIKDSSNTVIYGCDWF